MLKNKSFQLKIAATLRSIGSAKCLEKAKMIEHELTDTRTLNLRDLSLTPSNLKSIVGCFEQEKENDNQLLKSISFSYNHLIGDSGAIDLAMNLPKSICEIGLVDCGLSDIGGIEILKWMKGSSNLQMICIEQNNFSEQLKFEFRKFSASRPQVLVIY
jgi:hypothetical protein